MIFEDEFCQRPDLNLWCDYPLGSATSLITVICLSGLHPI
jgi:hypothetical protein